MSEKNYPKGVLMSGNYTEDDLREAIEAAVSQALAPFQEEAALETLSQAFEDVKAPLVAQIASLQNEVDTATLRADTAEANYNALVALLEDAKAAEEAAAELTARREARREAVKDLAFTAEYVEERLDRWVALSDDDFAELLDGWKAVATKKEEKVVTDETTIPATTAMKASREEDNKGDRFASIREISRLGLQGVNIRSL
jgi:hypothetical protein